MDRLPTDVVEARLNHLIDRARRNRLLPDEADRFTTELRDLVRRLENTEDDRDRVQDHLAPLDRTTLPNLHRRIESDAETIRRWRGRAESAELRANQAETEVARLTAGQCTDSRRMCDLHHTVPVDGCPYPRCVNAREQEANRA